MQIQWNPIDAANESATVLKKSSARLATLCDGRGLKWHLPRFILAVVLLLLVHSVAVNGQIRIKGVKMDVADGEVSLETLLEKKQTFKFAINPATDEMGVGQVAHFMLAEDIGALRGQGYVRGFFEPQADGSWKMVFENIQDYDAQKAAQYLPKWEGKNRAQTIERYVARLRNSPDAEPIVRYARGKGVSVTNYGAALPDAKFFEGGRPIGSGGATGTKGRPARNPGRPLEFYRVGMIDWNSLKRVTADGKRMFNLFISQEDAFGFFKNESSHKDRRMYRFTEADLAKTEDGRAFLDEVRAELDRNPDRVDMTLMVSDEAAFDTLRNIADQRVFMDTPPSDGVPDGRARVPVIARAEVAVSGSEPPAREVAPAAVEPDYQARVEALLNSFTLESMRADLDAGKFDIFKDPLFKPAGETPEAIDKVVRTWKKVLSKPEFGSRSFILAEMRRRMLVDIFAEVSRDHGVRIELIDSGKRNAYTSDIDVTVYAPDDARARVPIAALIQDAVSRFKDVRPQALDITIHNGDVFMPDIANQALTVEQYSKSLRAAVAELRLKVSNGGDASYFPGANLEDVQKRGLRDGIITELNPQLEVVKRGPDGAPLETRFKKPEAKTYRASEFNASGDLAVNSLRLAGLKPAYDRTNALGALSQNLEKIYRNGDKPGDIAKLFNRGMDLGAGTGSGEVNSYLNIHVSDLPTSNMSPEAAASLALEIEKANLELARMPFTADGDVQRKSKLNELEALRKRGGNKEVAKMRWITRVFGYRGGNMQPQNLTWLYDLLNATSEIEVDKSKGNFDFDKGRSRYLQPYFERQKAANAQLASSPEGVDKLYDLAWRDLSEQMVDAIEIAMVKTAKETLDALRPDAIKEYARKGRTVQVQGGKVVGSPENVQAQEQARKLAEKISVELVLLFDFINSRSNFDALDMTAEQLQKASAQRERLQAFREAILENVPQALKPDVEKLDKIAQTEMNHFLGEFADKGMPPPETTEKLIEAKEEAVKKVTEVGPDEADRSITKEKLAEHIKSLSMLLYDPAKGPLVQQTIDVLIEGLSGGFKTDPKTGEIVRDPKTGQAVYDLTGLAKQLGANLTSPLMVGSGAVSITRAYVAGGKKAATEAAVGEVFNLLPPAYGLLGIGMKDFSRGNYEEGWHSIKWLTGIHLLDKWIPGIGHGLLAYNIATGVPEVIYLYTTQKINEDLIEQAMRSVPVPGKRADRNPYRDSTDLFKGDTPNFPVFWDNPCMQGPDDGLTLKERFPMVSKYYSAMIAKDLADAGIKQGSPDWVSTRLKLLQKYAFDDPYYQRINKIYECYFPQVKAARDKGFDEENVLKSIFGKVVDDWYRSQDPGYQREFFTTLDTLRLREDEARKQLLGRITNYVIAQYKAVEEEPIKRQIKLDEAAAALAKQAKRPQIAEKQLVATKEKIGARMAQGLATHIAAAMGQSASGPKVEVQVKAPTWYVGMKGVIKESPGDKNGLLVQLADKSSLEIEVANNRATGRVLANDPKDDAGEIPIDVEVRSDRALAGQIKHDYKLELAGPGENAIKRGPPAGFIPNVEEKALLAQTGSDGKPLNDVFTVNMVASAGVYDEQLRSLARSRTVPVVGYVIAAVPKFSQTITLVVDRERSAKAPELVTIQFQAQLGKDIKRGNTSELTGVKFDGLEPGDHQITVTPDGDEWGPGSVSFKIENPYSKASLDGKTSPKNPETVRVTLPYKGRVAVTKPPDPDPDPADPKNDKPTKPKPDPDPTDAKKAEAEAAAKLKLECDQLLAQAAQFSGSGDRSGAKALLGQAKSKGCVGADAAIGAIQRGQDQEVQNAVNEVLLKSSQCEYEAALASAILATQSNPGHPGFAAINLPDLQAKAQAQGAARALLRLGQAAILEKNVDGAIAGLEGALAVPNLPECMRPPIDALLGELRGRKGVGDLGPQFDAAIKACDVKEATRLVGLVTAIKPRTSDISSWISVNVPKVADLHIKELEAKSILQQAAIAAADKMTPAARARVRSLVESARKKVAPCQLAVDPSLSDLVDDTNTAVKEDPEDARPQDDPNKKPEVEELPADADDTATSKVPEKDPELETIPEDESGTTPSKPGTGNPADKPSDKKNPGRGGSTGEKGGGPPKKNGGVTGGGGEADYGNLTGTWGLVDREDEENYSIIKMTLGPAGKNRWTGEATTEMHASSEADKFFLEFFEGSVDIVATAPGIFKMHVRRLATIHLGETYERDANGRLRPVEKTEKKWVEYDVDGTFTTSQISIKFEKKPLVLSRQ